MSRTNILNLRVERLPGRQHPETRVTHPYTHDDRYTLERVRGVWVGHYEHHDPKHGWVFTGPARYQGPSEALVVAKAVEHLDSIAFDRLAIDIKDPEDYSTVETHGPAGEYRLVKYPDKALAENVVALARYLDVGHVVTVCPGRTHGMAAVLLNTAQFEILFVDEPGQ